MIDRRLYLPNSWTTDPQRCAAAGVPGGVTFATKPRLARQMLAAALDAAVPASWVAGDEVYGADPQLRADLEARGVVAEIRHLFATLIIKPVVDLAYILRQSAWRRRRQGQARHAHYRRRAIDQPK